MHVGSAFYNRALIPKYVQRSRVQNHTTSRPRFLYMSSIRLLYVPQSHATRRLASSRHANFAYKSRSDQSQAQHAMPMKSSRCGSFVATGAAECRVGRILSLGQHESVGEIDASSPILHSPGLIMPGQLGPIRRVAVCCLSACLTLAMSFCGIPSVMHTTNGISF